MYATPKKSLFYELTDDDVNIGYNEALNHFKSYLNIFKNLDN